MIAWRQMGPVGAGRGTASLAVRQEGFPMGGWPGCMHVGTLSIPLAGVTVGFQVGRMVSKTSCTQFVWLARSKA